MPLLFPLFGAVGVASPGARAQGTGDPVVVVYDATTETDCELATQRNDQPLSDPKSCPAGMIIAAAHTTSDQVAGGQFGETIEVVEVTGDAAQDEAAIEAAMQDMADRFAPAPSGQASCNAKYFFITFGMNVGNERARINLEYNVRSNCNVVNIRDRAKTHADSNGEINWIRSCVQPPSGGRLTCKVRKGQLCDSYTRWYDDLPNTISERTWETDMEKWSCNLFCTTYRAHWSMD